MKIGLGVLLGDDSVLRTVQLGNLVGSVRAVVADDFGDANSVVLENARGFGLLLGGRMLDLLFPRLDRFHVLPGRD